MRTHFIVTRRPVTRAYCGRLINNKEWFSGHLPAVTCLTCIKIIESELNEYKPT